MRIILGVVSLAILLTTVAAVHNDLDGRYNPTCPACQLEHNMGCIALTASLVADFPRPTDYHRLLEMQALKPARQYCFRIQSTRSPPSQFL
jgi:hypothetical protein